MSNSRKGYIRKVLEDGSIEETIVYLPDNKTPPKNSESKPKAKRKPKVVEVAKEEVDDKDNKIKKEKQITKPSKASVGIKRTEG